MIRLRMPGVLDDLISHKRLKYPQCRSKNLTNALLLRCYPCDKISLTTNHTPARTHPRGKSSWRERRDLPEERYPNEKTGPRGRSFLDATRLFPHPHCFPTPDDAPTPVLTRRDYPWAGSLDFIGVDPILLLRIFTCRSRIPLKTCSRETSVVCSPSISP
jgi:hypothetical protein